MPQTSIQQLLPNTPSGSVTTASTGIASIAVLDGGEGYTAAPAVTASGPSSAAVLGSLIENRVVTSIVVQQPGSGCVTVPTVTIAPPLSVTAQWTADTAVSVGNVLQQGLNVYTVTVAGTTGTTPPTFTTGSEMNGTATLTYSGRQARAGLVILNSKVTGTARQAAGYLLAGRTLQTVSWRYTGVTARITIEATLESDPDTINWTTVLFSDLTENTDTDYTNIQGSWVWLRVLVENFTAGTIEYITLSY